MHQESSIAFSSRPSRRRLLAAGISGGLAVAGFSVTAAGSGAKEEFALPEDETAGGGQDGR